MASVKKFYYLCSLDGNRQQISSGLNSLAATAFRFMSGGFFILGSSRILPVVKQIVGQKSNALNLNIQKPKRASNDSTASTGDKEVRQKDRLYTLRDK